jgi:hypothetical protein
VTKVTQSVDPSTIPNYYGDFKPKSETGQTTSNAHFMGQDEDGNFVFDFRPDPKVVDATITQEFDNTNTTSLLRKR